MRWQRLFADLEAQAEAEERLDGAARTADLQRAEMAAIMQADRLRGARGSVVALALQDGTRLAGVLAEVADEWLLLDVAGREVVVPGAAVDAVDGLPARARQDGGVAARLGLGHVLRGLARDRAVVVVRTRGGAFSGRIARVGRDHLDVEAAGVGDARAPAGSSSVRFAAVLSVSAATF